MTNGLITLRQAQALLAEAGKQADINTIIRWIRKGLGKGDERVKLKAQLLGQWFTTAEWIDDFINRRTEVSISEKPNPYLLAVESVQQLEEAKTRLALLRASICRKPLSASAARRRTNPRNTEVNAAVATKRRGDG
jgi:hypothetical protein